MDFNFLKYYTLRKLEELLCNVGLHDWQTKYSYFKDPWTAGEAAIVCECIRCNKRRGI